VPFTAPEQRENVRVLQVGGRLDFAQEPLAADDGREFGLQHFDRNEALVFEIAREVHGGHATTPKFAVDGVAVGEGGGERRREAIRDRHEQSRGA